jgi:MFS family permease
MLFTTSVIARLPLATLTLGVLVHAEHLTGSYAAAGTVSGALAVAQGFGGPLFGRLVDRRGQTVVLVVSSLIAGLALCAAAVLPTGTPLPLLILPAALIGLCTPPVGACMRALIPLLRPGAERQRKAYAVDAAATELTWVAGPPLALGLGALAGSGAALIAAGVVLIVATAVFALSPASRAWRPVASRENRGAMRSPAMRVLVGVLVATGIVFGATEVGVTAAAGPRAGLLLGLWGVGSLAGGIVAAKLGGGVTGRGFTVLLALLGLGHLCLVADTTFVIVAAGSMIAPVLASAYAMVDTAAPAGTVTEAFAWLATASAVGSAGGAAVGGALIDSAGPTAAFVLAGAAGLVAAAVSAIRVARPAPGTS